MSIVFFGSPDFAVPSLRALLDSGEEISAVVTQPDKSRGRGRREPLPSPVKQFALNNGLKVLTPTSMKQDDFISELEGLEADLFVVVAYGRMLTPRLLALPSLGTVNVHASLLPKYRGASPVAWAIMKGDRETGVTTMLMDEGLDTGDILLQEAIAIHDDDTAGTLGSRLSEIGGQLLIATIKEMRLGALRPRPQGDTTTEYARLLSKEDGHIDWSKGALEIHNMVRALSPWPSAYCFLDGQRLKITRTSTEGKAEGRAGTVTEAGPEGLSVATGDGSTLKVLELQPEGRRPMAARDFLQGHRVRKGDSLG